MADHRYQYKAVTLFGGGYVQNNARGAQELADAEVDLSAQITEKINYFAAHGYEFLQSDAYVRHDVDIIRLYFRRELPQS